MVVSQVYKHIQKCSNADIVIWIFDSLRNAGCQTGELPINTFIFFENIADVIHLGQQNDTFI